MEYTEEQKKIRSEISEKWNARFRGTTDKVNVAKVEEHLPFLYRQHGFVPPVVVAQSPWDCQVTVERLRAPLENREPNLERPPHQYPSWEGCAGWASLAAWVEFNKAILPTLKEGSSDHKEALKVINEEGIDGYVDYMWNGRVFYAIAMDKVFCVCAPPVEGPYLNNQGQLHRIGGPVMMWPDGFGIWAVNGQTIHPKELGAKIDNGTVTKEDIEAITNSEIIRAVAEYMGWDKFLALKGTVTVDEWTDPQTGLGYELLDLKERIGELQPKWLRMQSPPLKDGSQPFYIEAVSPELKTAQAARRWKFQASKDKKAKFYRHGDVMLCTAKPETMYWPTPEECNKKPELRFEWEA